MEEKIQEIKSPKVFISYSHDSKEHKLWVLALAQRLRREANIDVVIDQWDAEPGDDLGLFMEKGVAESNRVLMICTKTYTQKANEGRGGAGYEAGIMRSEIINKYGTNKFIPIIPPGNVEKTVPVCVASRCYLDMSSSGGDNEAFNKLVMALRKYPTSEKPALGISPVFLAQEKSDDQIHQQVSSINIDSASAIDSYRHAHAIIQSNDVVEWNKFIRKTKLNSNKKLLLFRKENEAKDISTLAEASEMVAKATDIYSPLFAAALAGTESSTESYRHQAALVADILNAKDWSQSGKTVFIKLPNALAYCYHSLIGSVAVNTRQFDLAFELANFKIVNWRDTCELIQDHTIIGYQDSLDRNFANSIKFLQELYLRWEYLSEVFESQNDYCSALAGYNILLIFSEIIRHSEACHMVDDYNPWAIPPSFLFVGSEALLLTKQKIINDAQQVCAHLEKNKVSLETFRESWASYCQRWHKSSMCFRYNLRAAEEVISDLATLISR